MAAHLRYASMARGNLPRSLFKSPSDSAGLTAAGSRRVAVLRSRSAASDSPRLRYASPRRRYATIESAFRAMAPLKASMASKGWSDSSARLPAAMRSR